MITRLWKVRYLRVAGMAAGAVAVAGAAVVLTASAAGVGFSTKPAAPTSNVAADHKTPSTACSSFMKHFADELHKSQAEINTAFQKAIADTLADEVKSGQISQAQADAIKKKLAGQTPCNLPSPAGHGGGDRSHINAYMQQYLTAAAAALGITETELVTDLKSGQYLSQVAAAKHVSEADFRTRVIAQLQPVLDQAVKDKKLTADQETKILTGLKTGPLPLWNAPPVRPKTPITPVPKVPVTPSPKTV